MNLHDNTFVNPFVLRYDNDLDPWSAEVWAPEVVALLQENIVCPLIVNRDFEDRFVGMGKTVHTRKPSEFVTTSKNKSDEIVIQDVSATDIPIVMNQHIEVSFVVHDEDDTLTFTDVVNAYMRPMAIALARRVDRIACGQVYFFLENSVGALGGLTNSNGIEYITALKRLMAENFVPVEGRQLVITPATEELLLQHATFHQANRLGDDGQAVTMGTLGRKFGFTIWMAQNMPSIDAQTTDITALINEGDGYPVGTTVLTVDGVTGDLFGDGAGGAWVTINGIAYHVVDSALTVGDTTEITLEYGLLEAVEDDDIITAYPTATINQPSGSPTGYPLGYRKEIVVDAAELQIGQLVTFGTPGTGDAAAEGALVRYAIVETNGTTTMQLDKPLEAAILDAGQVNLGPSGDFNWGLIRDAVTLAVRPLKPAVPGEGGTSSTASFNGATVRITISRDNRLQARVVTGDFLLAVKPLDLPKGAVMLS